MIADAALEGLSFLTRRVDRSAGLSRKLWAHVKARLVALRLWGWQRRPEAGPTYVAGLLGTPSGIGRGAEAMLRWAPGGEKIALDINFVSGRRAACTLPKGGGRVIIHLNPPDFLDCLAAFGAARLERKTIIAYWAWETDIPPSFWRRALPFVDEVWTPSRFAARAIASAGFANVKVVPHYLDPSLRRTNAYLSDFGPRRPRFVAGFAFSACSNYARKNPEAVIESFKRAFPGEEDCALVIKAADLAPFPELRTRLFAAIGADPRILVIERTLDRREMAAFFSNLDVYVSLHRSEGFGLTLLEAAGHECALVLSAWSAPPEFLPEPNALWAPISLRAIVDPQNVYDPSSLWAEPDAEKAASALRALYESPEMLGYYRRAGRAAYEEYTAAQSVRVI